VVNNIRNFHTKNVNSITDLEITLRKLKDNKIEKQCSVARLIGHAISKDGFEQNMLEVNKQAKLFDYCASGLDGNLIKIVEILQSDTKLHIYGEAQKHYYFVNQKNDVGITPLYMSCLNGHVKVVELLIKYSADHLQKCGEKHEEQSVLDVSIRWGHVKLVEYLLTLKWDVEYLKNGVKEAEKRNNETIKKMLQISIKRRKSKFSCCF
jgi:hypothetical protein